MDRNGPSILNQLHIIFTNDLNNDKKYSVFDLLILLVFFYSLLGEETYNGIEEEERIKKFIISQLNALKETNGVSVDDKFLVEAILRQSDTTEFVMTYFSKLTSLASMKSGYKTYRNLYEYNEFSNKTVFKPLIKQICEDIIENKTLIDLEYQAPVTEGIKEIFKTLNFIKIGASVKPHPLNNEIIIIYFIGGGIQSYEMKLAKDIFEEKAPKHKLLIGGSSFYNFKKLLTHLSQ